MTDFTQAIESDVCQGSISTGGGGGGGGKAGGSFSPNSPASPSQSRFASDNTSLSLFKLNNALVFTFHTPPLQLNYR